MAAGDGTSSYGVWLSALKEVITGLMALSILGFGLYMLASLFATGGRVPSKDLDAAALKEAFERQKDVLLYGLSLVGTVLGYYFGRVPAELHAQQAQRRADKAQDDAVDAKTEASKAKTEKNEQANEFKRTLSVVKKSLEQPDTEPTLSLRANKKETGVKQAIAEVDEALKIYY